MVNTPPSQAEKKKENYGMSLQSWAKQYARRHGFLYRQFNAYHYRISNGKKHVDFWTNGSFRTKVGGYFRNGATKKGIDITYDASGCLEIKEQIKKLSEKP